MSSQTYGMKEERLWERHPGQGASIRLRRLLSIDAASELDFRAINGVGSYSRPHQVVNSHIHSQRSYADHHHEVASSMYCDQPYVAGAYSTPYDHHFRPHQYPSHHLQVQPLLIDRHPERSFFDHTAASIEAFSHSRFDLMEFSTIPDPVPPHPLSQYALPQSSPPLHFAPDAPHKVPSSRRQSRRPEPQWAPDCPISRQEHYSVKGTFWSSVYVCQFGQCSKIIGRNSFARGIDYMDAVYAHLREHASHLQTGPCRWQGCNATAQLGGQSERNRIRHISTHLPWYSLCLQCGSLQARPDTIDNCLNRKCEASPARRERVRAAKKAAEDVKFEMQLDKFYYFIQPDMNGN